MRKVPKSQVRANFFSNRVINDWNKLPIDIKNSSSVTGFKNKLSDYYAHFRTNQSEAGTGAGNNR